MCNSTIFWLHYDDIKIVGGKQKPKIVFSMHELTVDFQFNLVGK